MVTANKVERSLAQANGEVAGGPARALGHIGAIVDRALQRVRDISPPLPRAQLEDPGLQTAIEAAHTQVLDG